MLMKDLVRPRTRDGRKPVPLLLVDPAPLVRQWPFFGRAANTVRFVHEWPDNFPDDTSRKKALQDALDERVRLLADAKRVVDKLESDVVVLVDALTV